MSDSHLISTVSELIESVQAEEGLQAVTEVASNADGFVLKQAGRLAVGGLLRRGFGRLCDELKKRQEAGEIATDFERTDHGAKLLQEALDALAGGLDKDQAKAVQDVFLGLAKAPPENAMERIQQLSVLQAAASLTPWEIAAIYLLERTSKKYFDRDCESSYRSYRNEDDRASYMYQVGDGADAFSKVLRRHVKKEDDYQEAILDALDSLADKKYLASWGIARKWSNRTSAYLCAGVIMCYQSLV